MKSVYIYNIVYVLFSCEHEKHWAHNESSWYIIHSEYGESKMKMPPPRYHPGLRGEEEGSVTYGAEAPIASTIIISDMQIGWFLRTQISGLSVIILCHTRLSKIEVSPASHVQHWAAGPCGTAVARLPQPAVWITFRRHFRTFTESMDLDLRFRSPQISELPNDPNVSDPLPTAPTKKHTMPIWENGCCPLVATDRLGPGFAREMLKWQMVNLSENLQYRFICLSSMDCRKVIHS